MALIDVNKIQLFCDQLMFEFLNAPSRKSLNVRDVLRFIFFVVLITIEICQFFEPWAPVVEVSEIQVAATARTKSAKTTGLAVSSLIVISALAVLVIIIVIGIVQSVVDKFSDVRIISRKSSSRQRIRGC